MKLNDMITENVEALMPHLRDDIEKYIKLREVAKSQVDDIVTFGRDDLPDRGRGNRWVNKVIEYALRADPRYLKDARKKKPLNKTKSPFVRSILKWWLDPRAGGGIELPEDILVVSEVLHKFNLAKQKGLQGDPRDFDKWDDLVDALKPYLSEKEGLAPDALARLGLGTIFESSPWKVYVINEWDPGEPDPNSMHPDAPVHKAFEGTGVCVKHEHTFKIYGPPFYLVMRGARRFALIHYPSTQFKTMQNKLVSTEHFEEGLDFLQRFFASHPDHLAELSLNSIKRGGGLGDFRAYEKEFASEIEEVLNTPVARIAAERDANLVVDLAKRINEWPHFSSWPEGLNVIIGKDAPGSEIHKKALRKLVKDRGRIPEIEDDMSFGNFKAYVGWLLEGVRPVEGYGATETSPDPNMRIELTDKGRNLAQKQMKSMDDKTPLDAKHPLRAGVNWLAVERKLWGGHKIQPWPEMEQYVLKAEEPRVAVIWAKLMYDGERWIKGEPIIATDERAIDMYDRIVGMHLKNKEFANMDDPQTIVKRAIQTGQEFNDKESIILQDLNAAVSYAKHIIGPWPELEEKLKSEPKLQNKYRQEVLHGFY